MPEQGPSDGFQPEEKPRVEINNTPPQETGEFISSGNDKKWNTKTVGLIGGIVALLIIIGLGVYAGLRPSTQEGKEGDGGVFGRLPGSGEREEEEAPRTVSGLSGVTCDEPNRRPIGVMLAGDPINRPISGFAKADLVMEMPVLTSDVTRLTAYYQCGRPTDIGSVRSARHDYLFVAEGFDAILGHWGGSYHALNRIDAGEFQTINALSNPFNAYFRKDTLPPPYNGFTTYDRMWNALEKLGMRTTTEWEGYEFKDDAPEGERGAAGTLTVAWPGQYRVSYEYDPATNRYQRFWAGVKVVDGEDNSTPVAPSVVAIMRATNGPAEGPGGYNDMAIEGSGEAVVYQDGKEIKATWRKDERYKNDPIHWLDENGNEITFTRGQVWLMAVEPSIEVTYSTTAQ